MNRITALTVNYRTPDLLQQCISTFANNYPKVPHIVIDNGECEASLQVMRELGVTFMTNDTNVGHGPALHQGISLSITPYIFILDSDTHLKCGGFLELMLAEFDANPNLFALGWLRFTNAAGVSNGGNVGFPYVHPYAALLDVEKYKTLAPFVQKGAPAIDTMRDAIAHGYDLQDFPIHKYIYHKEAGTRGLFGGVYKVVPGTEKKAWRKYKI